MTTLAAPTAEAPARSEPLREEDASPVIRIGSERACDCPPSHLNCLTAKEWMKSQIGVWQFTYNGKDIRDKALHPAAFPVSLAEHVIKLFTHRGELVVDPFSGKRISAFRCTSGSRRAASRPSVPPSNEIVREAAREMGIADLSPDDARLSFNGLMKTSATCDDNLLRLVVWMRSRRRNSRAIRERWDTPSSPTSACRNCRSSGAAPG